MQELASGTPTASLLTGLGIDEYFTRTDGSGTATYLPDALGSTIALANGSGTILEEYSYEPFGGTSVSGSTSGNAFGFTGREADGSGLHYYRARYYDARLQRFIGEDPLGFGAGDVNLHAYVGNAPADFVDPTGEIAVVAIPIAAGCLGGAAGAALAPLWGRKVTLPDLLDGCLAGLPFGLPGMRPLVTALRPLLTPLIAPLLAPLARSPKPAPVEEIITRAARGRDGATSRIVKEIVGGRTNSITHQVERAGEVIHQHQTHIGKYGGERKFPDQWVQYPRIPR